MNIVNLEAPRPYLEFDEETHTYYANGERIPSVTQVLESVGAVEPDWFTEEQRIRGTVVHLLVAMNCSGKAQWDLAKYADAQITEANAYLAQWRLFRKHVKPEILQVEERVCDPIYRYAGRIDVRCKIAGEEWILDAKTNKSGYTPKWVKWQTAAYAHALDPVRPPRRGCVVLTPERYIGPIEFPASQYLSDRDDFLAMVRAVRAVESIRSDNP